MRRHFRWLFLFAFIVFVKQANGQDRNFYIFLAFGQSNMEGAARVRPEDTVNIDDRLLVMEALDCPNLGRKKGNWYKAAPPLCRCRTGLSPTDFFGRTMVAHLPKNVRVGIINVSVGGCKIELYVKDSLSNYVPTTPGWMKNMINEYDGDPYGRLVEMAKLAQKDGVIKGILLHQGEANPNDSLWTKKVKTVYMDLMKDLHLKPKNVPLLAGETVNADQGGICAGMNRIIGTLPQMIKTAHVISSAGCSDGPDNLHFNAEGYRELGSRYALKMLSLLGYRGMEEKARNPIIFADVPDMSMVRVGDIYYMSSTTMHMSPGVPVMSSKDLVNWKLVSYAYDTLANVDALNLANGKSTYGRGSWASSIRYHKGTYYVTTFAQTTGKTHIYSTKNIEKGPWKAISFSPAYHDHSLFFDDDGKIYLLYGNGKLSLVELNEDLSGVKPGGINQVVIENASLPAGNNIGLGAEGSQLYKVKGKYYLFNICWPRGGMRTVVIHRSDKITGPYEGRVGLQDLGVAQGGLIDMPDGNWYAYLFRDYGAVGRIPYLVPVKWEDGWPVLGVNGKVPDSLNLPAFISLIPGIVASDEFSRKNGDLSLPLVWQWNHNPDNSLWSLSQRGGFLRLTTGRTDTSFLLARNTLTQRTIGPVCSGSTALDVSGMKEGDFAGLALLQRKYGLAGVRVNNGTKTIVMVSTASGRPVDMDSIPLTQKTVYLKAECDFRNKTDTAAFFYSLDNRSWKRIGPSLKMEYTIPQFMGYRFGLFNYATKETGGFADFDFFRITADISAKTFSSAPL